MTSPKTKPETLLALHRCVPGFSQRLLDQLVLAVAHGNIEISAMIIEASINGCRSTYSSAAVAKEFLDVLRCPEKLTDKQLKEFAEKPLATGYDPTGLKFWHMCALDPTGKSLQRIIDLHKNAVTGECSLL